MESNRSSPRKKQQKLYHTDTTNLVNVPEDVLASIFRYLSPEEIINLLIVNRYYSSVLTKRCQDKIKEVSLFLIRAKSRLFLNLVLPAIARGYVLQFESSGLTVTVEFLQVKSAITFQTSDIEVTMTGRGANQKINFWSRLYIEFQKKKLSSTLRVFAQQQYMTLLNQIFTLVTRYPSYTISLKKIESVPQDWDNVYQDYVARFLKLPYGIVSDKQDGFVIEDGSDFLRRVTVQDLKSLNIAQLKLVIRSDDSDED